MTVNVLERIQSPLSGNEKQADELQSKSID